MERVHFLNNKYVGNPNSPNYRQLLAYIIGDLLLKTWGIEKKRACFYLTFWVYQESERRQKMLSATQKVTVKTIDVNTLCETIHHNRFTLLNTILFDTVLSHQKAKLKEDLGPQYRRTRVIVSFDCPVCSDRHFIHKGRRIRIYKSALGRSRIPILQVQCISCTRRFCPYKDSIGLLFTERISQTLKQR